MRNILKDADQRTLNVVERLLVIKLNCSSAEAKQLSSKYVKTINSWYTDFVNQESQHQTIDDVVSDIIMFEGYGV